MAGGQQRWQEILVAGNPVTLAEQRHVQVAAIADHDSVQGVKAAAKAGVPDGAALIPAIEVSTVANRRHLHILGYYIDVDSDALSSFILAVSADRTGNTRINFENARAWCRFAYEWERVLHLNSDQSPRRGEPNHRPN